jgi:excisionase family DNA binding protein
MSNQEQQDQLMAVNEVAGVLRVDATTVRRWIKHGILAAVSLPHANKRQAYRVKRQTVDKLLNTTSLVVAS